MGPSIIVALCLFVWWLEPFSADYLAMQRSAIANGYYWQFITANLVHTNFIHLCLNMAGVILLWAVHGQYFSTLQYLLACLFIGFVVTIGLYITDESLAWYGGFSGILHGLFMLGCYKDIQNGIRSSWLLLAGIWLKIGYEQFSGQSEVVAELIAANVAVDAHLYGAIGGFFWVFGEYLLTLKKRPS
ncbi:rhombosortase [Aliiglaciecola litoralis]|uniref:Rhombosortase n=1 Tax=Aliiglaciecola litoralis TaxID=582857 RepID=A0ABN1LBM1_9ALTE